jgi:hypothetical protein
MTNQNDNKKQKAAENASEKEVITNNTPPVTIDVGDPADPFERLQTQKVAIVP